MFDREKVIEALINDDWEYVRREKDSLLALNEDWFWNIMGEGFVGYHNMLDAELISECEARDISYLFGEDDDCNT